MINVVLAALFFYSFTWAQDMKDDQKLIRFRTGISYTCKTDVGKSVVFNNMTALSLEELKTLSDLGRCQAVSNIKIESKQVKPSAITDFVKELRDSICSAIKPGSFKVAIGVDAEGKIYGIGLGTNGSLEVTIDCK